jgi:hypothetical protein
MRASELTDETAEDCRIVARPPLTVDHRLIAKNRFRSPEYVFASGFSSLFTTFAVGALSSFFPAAKLWVFAVCVLPIVCSFWVLGLHRLRSAGRDPRKLYGHQRI